MKELISQETIDRVRRDNCFDFLRYIFAFSLIIVHFCTLTNNEQFWIISGQTRVKAFFTITGFLVTYSFLRRGSLKAYTMKRIRRIMPAYVTVILLCFALGWIISPFSFIDYFGQLHTYRYLIANLTMLNFLEPTLPGLFDGHVETAVNGSLWSMKFEMLFYALVPLMVYLMRKYSKLKILAVIFLVHIVYHAIFDILENQDPENQLYTTLNHASFNTMIYFFSGTTLLLYFDSFCRYIKYLLPICLLLAIIQYNADIALLNYIEPLLFSALIVTVAYFCRPLNFLKKYDNISYGLYLYHYPVIQTLIFFHLDTYSIPLMLLLTVVLTIILALLSWYLIEKPILNR